MNNVADSMNGAQMALEIDALRNRAEKAEDLAAYWQAQAEHLKKVLHAVELLDCSAITIENNGDGSMPWEIMVFAVVEGVEPIGWRVKAEYFGATLKEALERLAMKEAAT